MTEKNTTKLYGFINGQPEDKDGFNAMVLSERGDFLLEHVVDKTEDAPHFLGSTSEIHHDIYHEYAPEGFELVMVDDPLTNADVQAAYALHKEKKDNQANA